MCSPCCPSEQERRTAEAFLKAQEEAQQLKRQRFQRIKDEAAAASAAAAAAAAAAPATSERQESLSPSSQLRLASPVSAAEEVGILRNSMSWNSAISPAHSVGNAAPEQPWHRNESPPSTAAIHGRAVERVHLRDTAVGTNEPLMAVGTHKPLMAIGTSKPLMVVGTHKPLMVDDGAQTSVPTSPASQASRPVTAARSKHKLKRCNALLRADIAALAAAAVAAAGPESPRSSIADPSALHSGTDHLSAVRSGADDRSTLHSGAGDHSALHSGADDPFTLPLPPADDRAQEAARQAAEQQAAALSHLSREADELRQALQQQKAEVQALKQHTSSAEQEAQQVRPMRAMPRPCLKYLPQWVLLFVCISSRRCA